MKKIDKKAPYKGLTFKEFFAKRHPDLAIVTLGGISIDDGSEEPLKIIVGQFCGYAQGPMTDTGCMHVCPEYSSCDAAMETNDLVKIMDGEGGTWCDVCGETIPESSMDDIVRVSARHKRYKCCDEECAGKVR